MRERMLPINAPTRPRTLLHHDDVIIMLHNCVHKTFFGVLINNTFHLLHLVSNRRTCIENCVWCVCVLCGHVVVCVCCACMLWCVL